MKTILSATLALLALSACGQDEGAPGPLDAAAPDGSCRPESASTFSPIWKPPRTMPNACSDAQIDDAFTRCESASGTQADCNAFNRATANATCRKCLYSTEDESSYGPLVYLQNRVLTINLAGCLALADGHLGPTGCGAEMQAFEACKDAVCIGRCATFEGYAQCVEKAGDTVCLPYLDDAACGDPATYAPCVDHTSFEDFFRSFGNFFCGRGLPGGLTPDGGPSGDGGSAEPAMVRTSR